MESIASEERSGGIHLETKLSLGPNDKVGKTQNKSDSSASSLAVCEQVALPLRACVFYPQSGSINSYLNWQCCTMC